MTGHIQNIDTDGYFNLAFEYYQKLIHNNLELNEELPNNIVMSDLYINNKSISVMDKNKAAPCSGVEVSLELFINKHTNPIGHYILFVDYNNKFIDEFLVFT